MAVVVVRKREAQRVFLVYEPVKTSAYIVGVAVELAGIALVEVGFMTNQKELEALQDPDYQRKAAKALYKAVLEYLNED